MKKLKLIFVLLAIFQTCSLTVYAQVVVAPTTAECATSIDGSVVGTPNPLETPQVSPAFSGTLPSGNYFTVFAWYDAASHVTLVSPEIQTQLSATGELVIAPPASGMPATAVGMQVYIATSSGTETLQGTTTGSGSFTQSTALASGAAVPSTNNTICSLIANDAGWPTGTGYNVSLTTPGGDTYPGYPMQWQLLGPGNSINLSAGLPRYNGVVNYPVPILAQPYGHAPQSISGPLSLTNYNLTQVGKIGLGTAVPAWAIDAEGAGVLGAINANVGYLFNGAAPTGHVLLGNGNYYVDSALPVMGSTAIASVSADAGAGASSTIQCSFGAVCSDNGGEISLNTGSSPGASTNILAIAFGGMYHSSNCTFAPLSATSSALSGNQAPFLVNSSAIGFSIAAGSSALSGSTAYAWSYTCTFTSS
jgi:hypothetical protein